MKFAALAGFAALACVAGAQAAVYTYKDANGKTVFSDQPPPGMSARPLTVRPAAAPSTPSSPNASGAATPARSDADAQNARIREENAKIDAQNAKAKEENCQRARGNLVLLQQGGRVRFIDKNGNPQFMDDKNRAEQLRLAQDNVAIWCK